MKSIFYPISVAALLIVFVGFSSFSLRLTNSPATCGTYDVQLITPGAESSGNYEWVWSVTNPNPGNGTNCTLQNLSHWSIVLPADLSQGSIVSTYYSYDGVSWIYLPTFMGVDPSQDCYTGSVLKFDQGTAGDAPTYYKLVVSEQFGTNYVTATFKSGSRTGCATYADMVQGPGTPEESPR